MSKLSDLQAATTRQDVALLLKIKPAVLSFVLYKLSDAAKYQTFDIPKKSGGTRTICAPQGPLKLIQRRLSILLQDCWDELNLKKSRKDGIAHGFKRGRSIFTNARPHRNRNYVLNLDLKDFFPSINFGRVRGYFIKNKDFLLKPDVATVIAQIACRANALPQGSPCSPVISNMIGHVLDIDFTVLARKNSCRYSRYADDMTFSTNRCEFPSAIASLIGPHKWQASSKVVSIALRNGFQLNESKTRLQYHDSRQSVTGLTVNRVIGVKREYRNTTRAMVHNLFRLGTFNLPNVGTPHASNEQLRGRLAFIDFIDCQNSYIRYLADFDHASGKLPWSQEDFAHYVESKGGQTRRTSRESVFQKFLVFADFYAASRLTIICEGATDNIYILHAIRSLANAFPSLATKDTSGAIKVLARIYRYAKTRAGALLELGGGGTTHLAKFIQLFVRVCTKFSAPMSQHPTVIIYDSDDGVAGIEGCLKKLKVAIPKPGGFSRVTKNLYVAPIPLPIGMSKAAIEDLFPTTLLTTKVDGKNFSPKDAGMNGGYGKTVFAHKVVVPNAHAIDFSGFSALLKVIATIQLEHEKLWAAEKTAVNKPGAPQP